jgi:hypothetical protein
MAASRQFSIFNLLDQEKHRLKVGQNHNHAK